MKVRILVNTKVIEVFKEMAFGGTKTEMHSPPYSLYFPFLFPDN